MLLLPDGVMRYIFGICDHPFSSTTTCARPGLVAAHCAMTFKATVALYLEALGSMLEEE